MCKNDIFLLNNMGICVYLGQIHYSVPLFKEYIFQVF